MEPDEAGEYKIASGWGLVKQIRISGDRYIGPNAEAPEGENETVDKFGRIAHLFGRSRLFHPTDPSHFQWLPTFVWSGDDYTRGRTPVRCQKTPLPVVS